MTGISGGRPRCTSPPSARVLVSDYEGNAAGSDGAYFVEKKHGRWVVTGFGGGVAFTGSPAECV